jgi:hypothetical protein
VACGRDEVGGHHAAPRADYSDTARLYHDASLAEEIGVFLDLVFESPASEKAKLSALLEADPYAEKSFSRNGYKLKDGGILGQDKEKAYLLIRCTDEFAKFAREKLAAIASESKPEVAAAVKKKIEEEESNAEVGFGAIFGE